MQRWGKEDWRGGKTGGGWQKQGRVWLGVIHASCSTTREELVIPDLISHLDCRAHLPLHSTTATLVHKPSFEGENSPSPLGALLPLESLSLKKGVNR